MFGTHHSWFRRHTARISHNNDFFQCNLYHRNEHCYNSWWIFFLQSATPCIYYDVRPGITAKPVVDGNALIFFLLSNRIWFRLKFLKCLFGLARPFVNRWCHTNYRQACSIKLCKSAVSCGYGNKNVGLKLRFCLAVSSITHLVDIEPNQ